jgi:3-methylcrotonyl-CoA carboxylase alpha subunit
MNMSKSLMATIDGRSETVPAEAVLQLQVRRAAGEHGGGRPGSAVILDVTHGKRSYRVCAKRLPDGDTEIWVGRYRVVVNIQDEREVGLGKYVRAATGGATALRVKAPMPGLIKEIVVKEGDSVTKGQRLLTLEAMKMENEITSPGDGVVGKFNLTPGVSVEKDQVLIQLIKHEH